MRRVLIVFERHYGRVVLFYSFHGDRGHTAREHVDRHDGKHVPEDRRDPKRVAETSEYGLRLKY